MDTGDFFDALFGHAPEEGWVTLAMFPGGAYDPTPGAGPTDQMWFRWPAQRSDMIVTARDKRDSDLYVCPVLFRYGPHDTKGKNEYGEGVRVGGRKPENAKWLGTVYADADGAQPSDFKLKGSVVVETSPGRHHIYWRVTEGDGDPRRYARSSRAIAYAHRDDGCDLGGWDLAQLLRVPGTTNNKPSKQGPARVRAFKSDFVYTMEEIERVYPTAVADVTAMRDAGPAGPFPKDLPEYALCYAKVSDDHTLIDMLNTPGRAPTANTPGNRSQLLWLLALTLARKGLSREETFVLSWSAPCNKFRLEGREPQVWWEQVHKAYEEQKLEAPEQKKDTASARLSDRALPLLTEKERESVPVTWIDRYKAWGSSKTDASLAFHEAAAWTIGSSVMGEFGKLATRFDGGFLNLWFMVLGGTTLSRKSTVRRMMLRTVRLLSVDGYDYEVGSDATSEGLKQYLLERKGFTSLYHQDEVYGLQQETKAKGYRAGLQPLMTELYDGTVPGYIRSGDTSKARGGHSNFVMYMTGATDAVISGYTLDDFATGHLARFEYVVAPQEEMTDERLYIHQADKPTVDADGNLSWGGDGDHVQRHLVTELAKARDFWASRITRGDQQKIFWDDDAWERFNQIQARAVRWASEHSHSKALLPSVQRSVISMLRMGTILAMMDCAESVTMGHLLRAAQFFEESLTHTVHVVGKLHRTARSSVLDQMKELVEAAGTKGVTWAVFYRKFKDHYNQEQVKALWSDLVGAEEVRVEGKTIKIRTE